MQNILFSLILDIKKNSCNVFKRKYLRYFVSFDLKLWYSFPQMSNPWWKLGVKISSRCEILSLVRKINFFIQLIKVVRHGAWTPATAAYPKDPYFNDTYEPYGFGELTNVKYFKNFKKLLICNSVNLTGWKKRHL